MADSDITVSGLVVTPGFGQTFAEWAVDDPNWNGIEAARLDKVELWAATSNVRGTASKVSEGNVEAIHRVSDGLARWYWIKARNRSGYYGEWQPVSATGGVAAAATASIGTNGYLKLPSGMILQWGRRTDVTFTLITYPILFPNQCFNVQITFGEGSPVVNRTVSASAITPELFFAECVDSAGVRQAEDILWTAIGY